MRLLRLISIILLLTSCNLPTEKVKLADIRGSWYTNGVDGGMYDSLFNYVEIYVNDTTMWYQDEDRGQTSDQSYHLSGDTLFKCFGTGRPCEFIPMYRLKKYKNDTLWLTINSKYTKRDSNSFWVRLPKDEKGPYELTWTKENWDSLKWKIQYDYERRKYRYHLARTSNLERYDSFVRAGHWKWSMKEIRESEEQERKYLEKEKKTGLKNSR